MVVRSSGFRIESRFPNSNLHGHITCARYCNTNENERTTILVSRLFFFFVELLGWNENLVIIRTWIQIFQGFEIIWICLAWNIKPFVAVNICRLQKECGCSLFLFSFEQSSAWSKKQKKTNKKKSTLQAIVRTWQLSEFLTLFTLSPALWRHPCTNDLTRECPLDVSNWM